jgi:multiple sugar transport system permease protein
MRKDFTPWLLVIGAFVILLFNDVFPTLYAFYLSLHVYNLVTNPQPSFTYLNNYANLLRYDLDINASFIRGFTFSILTTIISLFLGLAVAFFMAKDFKGKSIFRIIMCLPLAIPPITVGSMWKLMCNPNIGIIPYFLKFLGITYDISFNSLHAFITVLIMDLWHWTPLVGLVLLASLASIPKQIIESAEVDGASWPQKLRYIYFPLMALDILFVAIIRFMDSLKIFDEIWMLTGGGPGTSTRLVSIALYSMVLKRWDMGYGAAVSMVFTYVIIFVSWILYKILQVRRA